MFISFIKKCIISDYLNTMYMIILFIGIAVMIHMTLPAKYSKLKIYLGWFKVVVILYVVNFILYGIQNTILFKYEEFFKRNVVLYNFVYGFGLWMYVVQLGLLVITAYKLYKTDLVTQIFVVSILYMYTSLIADYIMPLMLVAMNPTVHESGYYVNFAKGGGVEYIIIGISMAVILCTIYKIILCKYVLEVLQINGAQRKKLVVIPITSYITYSIIYLLLSYADIYPSMPKGLPYFIIILATLISIYAVMYIALFYGIISTKELMSTQAELDIVANIQMENMPSEFNHIYKGTNIDVKVYIKPAKYVSGDFFDYFFIAPNKLAILIADVSGKGLPSAMFMMKAKTLIKGSASYCDNISEIFEKVNEQLCENNLCKMFVTAFMGIIDIETGIMTYTNAGHNYPLFASHSNEYKIIKTNNSLFLGGLPSIKYNCEKIQLDPNDSICIYTDGVTEALNSSNTTYGEKRFLTALNDSNKNATLQETLVHVINDIANFVGNTEQSDDITLMLIQYKGNKVN